MTIRVHLALALLAAALVPLAVVLFLGRPLLEETGRRLEERERAAAEERLAAAAREPGRDLLERAWALRAAAAREGLLGALARRPAGRRDRRAREDARRRFLALAAGAGVRRGLLLRAGAPGEAPLLAWPGESPPDPSAGLPPADRAAWIAEARGPLEDAIPVRLRATAPWPPAGDAPRLLLVVEEVVPAGELAARLAERAGVPVRVVAGPVAADGAVVVDLPGGILRAVAEPPRVAGSLLARARRAFGWAALVALGVSLLFALVLGHLLAAPVRELARAVDRVAEEGHPAEPMPPGPGEIGRLAARIDRMLAALRDEHGRRVRAERLAAWREVARRVAHEVRNPLTPIRLAVDNLERLAARDPAALPAALPVEAAAIREEVVRLERLVREFHDFARMPEPRPAPVDLGELARGALRARLGADGPPRWEVTVEPGVPEVRADADLLRTLLGNLAGNAAEAGAGHLRIVVRMAAPGRVELLVEDDGPGVPEELRERVFEPYVTGREGTGTGLGLAICRRIAEDHGGTIELLPSETGARFRVELPVAGPGS